MLGLSAKGFDATGQRAGIGTADKSVYRLDGAIGQGNGEIPPEAEWYGPCNDSSQPLCHLDYRLQAIEN
jgi:hypothetical protein